MGALVINGGTAATVRGNELIESGPLHVFEGSDVRIEANVLRDGPNIAGVFGDATVIRQHAGGRRELGANPSTPSTPVASERSFVSTWRRCLAAW